MRVFNFWHQTNHYKVREFSDWTSNICVNANVYAIVLVSGVIIASILFVAGGIKAFANKNKLVFSFIYYYKTPPTDFYLWEGFL